MIYVDPAVFKKTNGRKLYAHMVADSLQELHEFAARLGVGKHFFHSSGHPHYDVTEDKRYAAVVGGAREISSRELLTISLRMNISPVLGV